MQTLKWFYDKTPDGLVTHIFLAAPYSPELTEAIRGPKMNKGAGGLPRCNKRFSDEKFWILTPIGRVDFTPDALQTLITALEKLKAEYEAKILPTLRRPSTWRFSAKKLGISHNFTGTHEAFNLIHQFQDGDWVGCDYLPGKPASIPFDFWVWVPEGSPHAITLSPSAMGTFEQCPFKFFLEKVIGLRTPNRLRTHIGSAAHLGCEGLHIILKDQTVLNHSHYAEAEALAEKALFDQGSLDKLETKVEAADIAIEMKNVQRMIRHYYEFVRKYPVRVLATEENFSVPTGVTVTHPTDGSTIPIYLTGATDLRFETPEGDAVSDLKTTVSRPFDDPQIKVLGVHDQILQYALMATYSLKRPVPWAEIREVHPFEGVRPTRIPVQDALPYFKRELQDRVQRVAQCFSTGHFPRRRAWSCSNCGLADFCTRGMTLPVHSMPSTNSVLG